MSNSSKSPGQRSDALSDATKDMKALQDKGKELGWGANTIYAVANFIAANFTKVYWRGRAHNPELMPTSGAFILAPVHRSNLDVPLVGATSPRRLRYLAKGSLFKTRFWAYFLTAVGGFPLDRDSAAPREALRASIKVLDRGEPLVVFPEGERKAGPIVQECMDGAVWLSVRSGAPILPMGIGGSERALPKGANVPKPTKLVFLYGDLIYPPKPLEGKKRVGRKQIAAATLELHDVIQDLYDRAQDMAGCPNPPR